VRVDNVIKKNSGMSKRESSRQKKCGPCNLCGDICTVRLPSNPPAKQRTTVLFVAKNGAMICYQKENSGSS
jgi:hypothetical protein